MNTLTLASIYELQGHKKEALEIYKEILKKDPQNHDAKIAIKRLSGMRKKYTGVNEEKKAEFIKMENRDEFIQFERWLSRPWI